jgi:microcystin degradation protein MlrC
VRIYIAGVQHESSSFSPIPTAYRSFVRELWTPEHPDQFQGYGYGEACALATEYGIEVAVGPFFNAQPSLPCSTAAWEQIVYPTPEEPFSSFVARMTADQFQPGVLMVSLNHGFEGSDSPVMSGTVVVTVDGNTEHANEIADRLAADFLSTLRSRSWSGFGVVEAIDEALRLPNRPVVIADRSDNPGAGAPGDSTYLLAEMISRGLEEVALGILWDPMATDICHDAGVGARLPLRIGGKAGRLSGQPIDVDAEVISVRTDAMQALFGQGEPHHPFGRSAAIRIDGIEIVINTLREQVFSPHVFTEHGIDPTTKRLVVVKSMQHFMGGFAPIAGHVVRCDGPGVATLNLVDLPFRRVRRPLLGLDPIELIEPEPMALAAPTRFTGRSIGND